MTAAVEVSVIIVNYETSAMVRRCVESLQAQSASHEIIVVDNPSDSRDVANLADLPVALVQNSENVGYGLGVNAGAAMSNGRVICVLNPDTVLPPGTLDQWLQMFHREAGHRRLGCLAPQLVNDNGTPQRSAYGFVNPANYWLHHSLLAGWLKWVAKRFGLGRGRASGPVREVDWAMGAAMLFPRDAWSAVGGFSPDYFVYAEDMDICWRLRAAGFAVCFSPEVVVTHTQGQPSAQGREVAVQRLFTGLKTFLDLHYTALPRATIYACVLADMAMRVALFALPATLNLGGEIYRSRVRGYLKVLRLYLTGSSIQARPPTQ